MIRVRVDFHVDRDKCGTLNIIDERGRTVLGPCSVSGRASALRARSSGNAKRDSLLRYGDTPTGGYVVGQILKSGSGTPFPAAEFGPNGVAVLEGISGNAAIAEANGRFHFLIQGGKLAKNGLLRSTAGALRLSNDDLRRLVVLLRKHSSVSCEIREQARVSDMGTVFDDPACDYQDPPQIGSGMLASVASASLSRREALLSGGAGAMAFGLSVTFVGLESVTPARAYTRLAYNEPAEAPATVPGTASPGHSDYPEPPPPGQTRQDQAPAADTTEAPASEPAPTSVPAPAAEPPPTSSPAPIASPDYQGPAETPSTSSAPPVDLTGKQEVPSDLKENNPPPAAETPAATPATEEPPASAPAATPTPEPTPTEPTAEPPTPEPATSGAAPANGATQQLENGTNGQQTTGQTFDNGPGPSDAIPKGNTDVPELPSPPQPTPEPPQEEPTPTPTPEGEGAPTPNKLKPTPDMDVLPPKPVDEPIVPPKPIPNPDQPITDYKGATPPSPSPAPQTNQSINQSGSQSTSQGGNQSQSGSQSVIVNQTVNGPGQAPQPSHAPRGYTPQAPTYTAPPGNSTTYAPGDQRTTPGGINQIQGGGQPITGPGVSRGAPDKAPPPNPTPSAPVYSPSPLSSPRPNSPPSPSYRQPHSPPASPTYVPTPEPSPSPPTVRAPAVPKPAPATAPPAAGKRNSKTVIDIFPSGKTPKSGDKPPT